MTARALAQVLALVAAALLLLYIDRAHGEPLAPREAVAYAKSTGRLPPWFNFGTSWRLKLDQANLRIYGCLTNPAGTKRWAGWMGPEAFSEILEGGLWTPRPGVPTTDADYVFCWPPPAPAPVAIGDPVYDFVAYSTVVGTALKWGAMDAYGVYRQALPGETCEPSLLAIQSEHDDPAVGWYPMRDGGMTRCRAP